MNKQIIPHVFGSLQTLERYVDQIRSSASRDGQLGREVANLLRQSESVLQNMRRTANRLQLQLAAKDAGAVVRSLRIFYGLNHIVRPELLTALAHFSKGTIAERPRIEAQAALH